MPTSFLGFRVSDIDRCLVRSNLIKRQPKAISGLHVSVLALNMLQIAEVFRL